MKKKKTLIISILVVFLFGVVNTSLAQRCGKKKLCEKDLYADYDYRSQSSSAVLTPGDTARTNIVVYSRNDFRILLCCDEELGDVNFKIYHPSRKTRQVIVDIEKNEEDIPVYKKDADGNPVQQIDDWDETPLFDESGNPVYIVEKYEKVISYDTTWTTEEYVDEELVYDSQESDIEYKLYDETVSKTKRFIIEVIVPESETEDFSNSIQGCVNVNVGRKSIQATNTFRRK